MMFKIKCATKPEGTLHNTKFSPINNPNEPLILKHYKGRLYKAFYLHEKKFDINDGRGSWNELDIIDNINTGKWTKIDEN